MTVEGRIYDVCRKHRRDVSGEVLPHDDRARAQEWADGNLLVFRCMAYLQAARWGEWCSGKWSHFVKFVFIWPPLSESCPQGTHRHCQLRNLYLHKSLPKVYNSLIWSPVSSFADMDTLTVFGNGFHCQVQLLYMLLNPLTSTYSTPFLSWVVAFWNQSLYCSFSQIHLRLVIAFTVLLLLKLTLSFTLQIEYCSLSVQVLNWWERKGLNYPGDLAGRGKLSLSHYLPDTGTRFSLVCVAACISFIFPLKSQIARRSTALRAFQWVSVKVTLKFSSPCSFSPWERLTSTVQITRLVKSEDKPKWSVSKIRHRVSAPSGQSLPDCFH